MGENQYTCAEYRQEMILAGLKKRLAGMELCQSARQGDKEEKKALAREIQRLERAMGLD